MLLRLTYDIIAMQLSSALIGTQYLPQFAFKKWYDITKVHVISQFVISQILCLISNEQFSNTNQYNYQGLQKVN